MFFLFFLGEHKFRVELHGNLRPGTSLISTERVTNGITMCVQNQWAFLKVEILNLSVGGLINQFKLKL